MDSNLTTATNFNSDINPFDSIRKLSEDGSEYWSARELMPLLGYKSWQKFQILVERTERAINLQGQDSQHHITRKDKLGKAGTQVVEDFIFTRYACYLIAMSGDNSKIEIAGAQSYFVMMTRQAELAPQQIAPVIAPRPDQLLIHQSGKYQTLTAKLAEDLERIEAIADPIIKAAMLEALQESREDLKETLLLENKKAAAVAKAMSKKVKYRANGKYTDFERNQIIYDARYLGRMLFDLKYGGCHNWEVTVFSEYLKDTDFMPPTDLERMVCHNGEWVPYSVAMTEEWEADPRKFLLELPSSRDLD